jgi:hypothetical protein
MTTILQLLCASGLHEEEIWQFADTPEGAMKAREAGLTWMDEVMATGEKNPEVTVSRLRLNPSTQCFEFFQGNIIWQEVRGGDGDDPLARRQ